MHIDSQLLLVDLLSRDALALEDAPLLHTPPPAQTPHFAAHGAAYVEGMLLGLAIGDALGRPTESLRPSERLARFGAVRDYIRGRSRFNGPKPRAGEGSPSDDTQLAAWTLESLLACEGLNPDDLLDRFAGSTIYGMGQSVGHALQRHRGGLLWYRVGVPSAGNGALMRIAPILLPHLAHPTPDASLWSDTALCAALTHNDRASTSSCVALVAMLWHLLGRDPRTDGAPAPEWWFSVYDDVAAPLEGSTTYRPRGGAFQEYTGSLAGYVAQHARPLHDASRSTLELCEQFHSGAYLMETVPCALLILARHAHDPEEALIRAVNDTKDNDTVAAIVGAAVGALHGVEALPQRWRDQLSGRTRASDDGHLHDLIARAIARWVPSPSAS